MSTQKPDKQVIADLKAEHGRVFQTKVKLAGEEHVFLFRLPARGEFKRFQATLAKGKEHAPAAFEQLCADCIVFPPDDVLERMLQGQTSGFTMSVGGEIAEQAGFAEAADTKEL